MAERNFTRLRYEFDGLQVDHDEFRAVTLRVLKNIKKFMKRRRFFKNVLPESCTGLDELLELQILRWRTTELVYTRIQIYLKKLYDAIFDDMVIEKLIEKIKHQKNIHTTD